MSPTDNGPDSSRFIVPTTLPFFEALWKSKNIRISKYSKTWLANLARSN